MTISFEVYELWFLRFSGLFHNWAYIENDKTNILQIDKLQKEKLELQIFLDLYGQESHDNR